MTATPAKRAPRRKATPDNLPARMSNATVDALLGPGPEATFADLVMLAARVSAAWTDVPKPVKRTVGGKALTEELIYKQFPMPQLDWFMPMPSWEDA